MKYYEIFSHTADLGFKVFGKTKEQLFENSGKALFDILIGIENIKESKEKNLTIRANNLEDLLLNTLSEFLFTFSVKKLIFKNFFVKFINENEINIIAKGEEFNKNKHIIKREIKAITYHDFKVYKEENIWCANIVIDI